MKEMAKKKLFLKIIVMIGWLIIFQSPQKEEGTMLEKKLGVFIKQIQKVWIKVKRSQKLKRLHGH